ncbi:ABC transporter permease [Streptomyces sp. B-S-A8]|uniref:ABC transporter permease n=1 Tax=Streptomyces solicavernae TaxID=3043614 RepID=A0ABT6RVZ0_9ACTN|nr:ABC transporter permease [Streptomyces sp. B-S-A8]MDI3387821.1 ABC transporter permease [Streptomyces sp. B-S-A8]
MRRRLLSKLSFGGSFAVLMLAYLYAPLVLVVLYSFHRTGSLSIPFTGFSLRWYAEVFSTPLFLNSILYGVQVSVTVTVLAVAIGVAAAFGLSRACSRASGAVTGLLLAPMTMPAVFLGTGVLMFVHRVGIPNSFWTIVLGQLLVVLPLVVVIMRTTFDRLDPAVEEAARDLGASGLQVFLRVTLPAVRLVIAGAASLAFVLSFDEFPVTFFTSGTNSTVPLYIYALLSRTVDPSINAVSSLLMLFTFAVLGVSALVVLRNARRGGGALRGGQVRSGDDRREVS